jgi:hypothetical protein
LVRAAASAAPRRSSATDCGRYCWGPARP